MFITTLLVSFCKDGVGSVNVKLWFLVVCVRCEVTCRLVVAIFLSQKPFRCAITIVQYITYRQ